MTARAMWKGAIHFGGMRVPVKFYAAVADKSVHFRLLHEKDQVPVKQAMVNPETDDVVSQSEAQYAYVTEDHDWVVLDEEDFDAIEPEASREIDILHFLPAGVIDHRWYLRPYYLGPDGDEASYGALIKALEQTGRVTAAAFTNYERDLHWALKQFRQLVLAFYSESFNFGAFIRAYPELHPRLVDALVGNVFADLQPLFDALEKFSARGRDTQTPA